VKIQEWNNMPRYKEKSKKFVADKIVERIGSSISEDDIQAQMCKLLYERDYDSIGDEINEYRIQNNKRKRRKRWRKRRITQ
jgi:hypothetical protein